MTTKQVTNTAKAPAFVLAAISPETASQVGKGLVKAATKAEGATRTLLAEVSAIVRLIAVPLTAAQWTKQVQPSIKQAFKASRSGLVETTVASYLSRFKTAGLAMLSGDTSLQPVAGETFPAYLGRVSEPLSKLVLADGRAVFDPDKVRAGRAAGTKASKPGKGAGSKADADHTEGGMNVRPKLAAALILTDQNEGLAQKLEIAMTSYRDDFSKWVEGILSESDKKELQSKLAA